MRQRGRGSSLGFLSGRLRGGFVASALPRSRPSTLDTAVTSPVSPGASWSGDQSVDAISDGGDVSTQLFCIANTLRGVQETMKRMERKVLCMEQRQTTLMESVKEINTLIKNQERANFAIKGPTWEVRNVGYICSII